MGKEPTETVGSRRTAIYQDKDGKGEPFYLVRVVDGRAVCIQGVRPQPAPIK